jgi:GNAT superfamily N-acetyltransferase
MAELQYRAATEDDFERLLALRIAAMQPSLERIGRFEPQRARERFRGSFAPQFMRMIFEDEQLIGCVTVRPEEGPTIWVEHLYIAPSHQGRGVGAEVMNAITANADRAGHTIRIAVLRESDANAFYTRLGFCETNREEWDIYYSRPPSQA